MMPDSLKYELIVIGGSWGGLNAIMKILEDLPKDFLIPVIIVLHRKRNYESALASLLQTKVNAKVKEAEEKEKLRPGVIYLVPANYHLLIEEDHTFSFDVSGPVHYSRPSIDVTFESASQVFKDRLVGIILTGANHDGAVGLRTIGEAGGITVVQDPSEAESSVMPTAAIQMGNVAHILSLEGIKAFLLQLHTSLQTSAK